MMVAVVVVGMVVVMVVGNEAGAPEMFIVPRLIASYFPWTVTFLCWSRQFNNYALGWFPSLDASGRSLGTFLSQTVEFTCYLLCL